MRAGIPRSHAMSELQRLPLFPLHSVLFPQGILKLRIFEARYLDMIGRCMREGENFGICLIAAGEETGKPAGAHVVGTEARIIDWDMSQPGILGLTVRGERRFRLHEQLAAHDGLLSGIVEWFAERPAAALGETHASLQPLMRMILQDTGRAATIPAPHEPENPRWLGYRYAEVLPIPASARQRLLALEDDALRLDIILEYLRQQGLIERA